MHINYDRSNTSNTFSFFFFFLQSCPKFPVKISGSSVTEVHRKKGVDSDCVFIHFVYHQEPIYIKNNFEQFLSNLVLIL